MRELVATGREVVLDFSFWSRRTRDDYRRSQYFDHFEVPSAEEGPLTVVADLPTGTSGSRH